MNSIESREIELLKKWAKDNYSDQLKQDILSCMDKDCNSYWTPCTNDDNVIEYHFQDIASLKRLLENTLQENIYSELYLPLAVAAFKGYRKNNVVQETGENGKTEKIDIPDFVYVF